MMDQQPNHQTQLLFRKYKNEWLYNNLNGNMSRNDLVKFFMKAAKCALNQRNINAGWKNVGMKPWNPSKLQFTGSLQYHMPQH